jgi:hypothetical protein
VKGTENISRPVNQYQSAFFTHIALQFKKLAKKLAQKLAKILVAFIATNGISTAIAPLSKQLLAKTVIWPKSLLGRRNKCARTIRARHLAIGAKRQPYLRMSKRTTTTITGHPRLVCDNYI